MESSTTAAPRPIVSQERLLGLHYVKPAPTVIGEISPPDLALPLRHARELPGREINPTLYSPAEFAKKLKAKDHFLTQVLTKATLLVLGSGNELDKAARKQDGDASAGDQGRSSNVGLN